MTRTQNHRVRKDLPHGFAPRDGTILESATHTRGSTGWQLFEALLPEHLKQLSVKQQQQTQPRWFIAPPAILESLKLMSFRT